MAVRPTKELPFQQMVGLEADHQNKTGWRHSRSGPTTDWAEAFTAAYGEDWFHFASTSTGKEWRANEKQFVDKINCLWDLPER
eukprot:12411212-Karenia_brevis.AAC.1